MNNKMKTKYEVLGLRIEQFVGQSVSGHNCDFEYSPEVFVKHILLPILGLILIINFTDLNSMITSIIIMELMVPLAVNNVNFSVIYNTKPTDVAATILVSSAVFVLLLHFYIEIIEYFI